MACFWGGLVNARQVCLPASVDYPFITNVLANDLENTRLYTSYSNIEFEGDFAIVMSGRNGYFLIYDLSDPEVVNRVTSWENIAFKTLGGLTVSNGYAYVVSDFTHRVSIVDISDKQLVSIIYTSSQYLAYDFKDIILIDDLLFSLHSGGFLVHDVSDKNNVSLVSDFTDAGIVLAQEFVANSNNIFIILNSGTVLSLDVSDINNVQILSSVSIASLAGLSSICYGNGSVFIAGEDTSRIVAVDVENPNSIFFKNELLLSTFTSQTDPKGIKYYNNHLYFVTYDAAWIVSVADTNAMDMTGGVFPGNFVAGQSIAINTDNALTPFLCTISGSYIHTIGIKTA